MSIFHDDPMPIDFKCECPDKICFRHQRVNDAGSDSQRSHPDDKNPQDSYVKDSRGGHNDKKGIVCLCGERKPCPSHPKYTYGKEWN